MNSLAFVGALLGIVALGLAIFTPFFAQRPHQKIWVYFNYLVGLWGFGLMMLALAGDNQDAARLWWKVITLPGMFIPVVFYHFVVRLCEWKTPRKVLLIAYAQAAVFWILFSCGVIGHGLDFFPGGYYYVRLTSSSYGLLFLFWASYSIYPHVIMLLSLKRADPDRGIAIKYILVAMLIAFGSGSTFHWLSVFGYPAPPALNILLVMFLLLTTYSIFRTQLLFMDLKVRKSIVYTILVSAISAVYLVGVYFVEHGFLRGFIGYDSLSLTVVALAIIIFAVEPLRLRLQHFIDNLFYKGSLPSLEREKDLLQNEIVKQDRMKSIATFAAGMAHEIKNPLTSIQTFAEYLPAKYDDPSFRHNFSKIVASEIKRINQTVTGLLDFAKPRALTIKECDLSLILNEVASLMEGECVKHGVTISRLCNSPRLIEADANALKQVLLNLILNAIQAMPAGGQIKIGWVPLKDKTEIFVQDTGPGIKEELLPKIFEPFFTTKESGSGLGLSIVYSIVQSHGGKITAVNTGTGLKISVVL